MKRSRITLRTRQVAMTTAALAIFLYAWDWLVPNTLLRDSLLTLPTWAHPSSPVTEALLDLLVAFVVALAYQLVEHRGSRLRGVAFGFACGLLAYVPVNLAFSMRCPPGQAPLFLLTRALPGVVALTISGFIASLIHRRND